MTVQAQASESDKWEMKIGRSVYGPYTYKEMENLVVQGLLAPHSRICKYGSKAWDRASNDPSISVIFGGKHKPSKSQDSGAAETPEQEPVNFALFMEIASNANIDLFQAIRNLGPSSRISGSCWLLKTDKSAGAIRNALVPLMANSDKLLVIDTSRSKLAWFNLGPEADSKIRKVWD